jgi:phosphomannomutase
LDFNKGKIMHTLMIGVSGVRGIYGKGLDDTVAERFSHAFGTLYRGTVVVGRDSRVSGSALARAVISGLRKAGSDVIDLGLASTPTTEMAVTFKHASGGVIITASHNPREWNGLKFLGPDGVFLDSEEGARLAGMYSATGNLSEKPLIGSEVAWDGADEHHISSILALDIIDRDTIASKRFTVCLDAVNGAGGSICTSLLERLGCTVFSINTEPNGEFPHGAEPVPDNITDLCKLVKEKKVDIGFAVDPDVDRLSIVDETGKAPGEEYTLAIAADYLFGRSAKNAACNLSTSRMIDDAADRHGAMVYRAPVGEINVVKKMREVGAEIGGEGNGGVIYPALHSGRDAVMGMALLLQCMAEKGEKISDLAAHFPRYLVLKKKMDISGISSWKDSIKTAFMGETLDESDGVKIIRRRSWIHVRSSNTEPVIRIIAEASTNEELEDLVRQVDKAIK